MRTITHKGTVINLERFIMFYVEPSGFYIQGEEMYDLVGVSDAGRRHVLASDGEGEIRDLLGDITRTTALHPPVGAAGETRGEAATMPYPPVEVQGKSENKS